jgi:4,5-DOPA dioxygenase extradiol
MARERRNQPRRREFLQGSLAALVALACRRAEPRKKAVMVASNTESSSARMPVLFVGHGSPMNAIEDNRWSRAFRALGEQLPRPRAVLCVSAHWYTPGTFLTDNLQPETIHDFGGFPPALHQMQYPAPGAPELAQHVRQLLAAQASSAGASLRSDWGLDHGTWSVLVHLLPAADVPVVQLSIDGRLPAAAHIELGKALSPLREEGVLVLGSGNIVHNLRDAFGNMQRGITATPAWAAEFDRATAAALEQRDAQHLASSLENSTGRNSHPTPEHYLPLLYAFGASSEGDRVSYPISGFDAGSLSMRAVRFS